MQMMMLRCARHWCAARFARWRLRQAVLRAGLRACRPRRWLHASWRLPAPARMSEEVLSAARDADGVTALGGAAAAGASTAVILAVVAAGSNASLPDDLLGFRWAHSLWLRAGQRQAADWLHRAATKAVARAQPLFRDVCSMLVVGTDERRPRRALRAAGRPEQRDGLLCHARCVLVRRVTGRAAHWRLQRCMQAMRAAAKRGQDPRRRSSGQPRVALDQ
jgi:hypothetical protein